jgi:hypothetical protein
MNYYAFNCEYPIWAIRFYIFKSADTDKTIIRERKELLAAFNLIERLQND